MKLRTLAIGLLVGLTGLVTVTATASKDRSEKTRARVVAVPTGDTLLVKVGKAKKATRVHLLGVHTPAPGACYGGDALAATKSLALGKQVWLVGTLAKGAYAQLPTGDDLGFLLLGRGAAQVDVRAGAFDRIAAYVPVQETAEQTGLGMWKACASDIEVAMTGPDTGLPGQALTYPVTVTNHGPLAAPNVQLQLRPGDYVETLVSVTTANGTCTRKVWMAECTLTDLPAGATANVTVVMRGSKFGIMSARAEASLVGCDATQCANTPLLDPNLASNRAAVITLLPGGGYEKACDKSYPTVCIPLTPPDLDCEDFLPLKSFPVRHDFDGADPHHLDGNGDGIACEAEDY